ncbi:MAG: aspartate/glutamate racemase family protein [Nitrososphaeria archaeon]|nr:aspartate/glutamate racemase family protein [Nitrososphaeria archaeon]NIN52098.1 aspartate/glutamate racemase family protein [Nitrososphaeria archaeon]NIQ32560.1 aspartate/glutamate racemase family protein [Nitrososphaeria archaeon]
MKLVRGGRIHYGEAIGIITLNTRFPRIPGDVANATTYDFPVRFKVVREASVQRVVKEADPELLRPFVKVAQKLEADGVRAITSTCGFLIIFQEELSRVVEVPVFTSTLLLVPLVYSMTNRRVGIITADSASLKEKHLEAAKIDSSTPIAITGLEKEKEFAKGILGDSNMIDVEKIEGEVVKAARGMLERHPDVGSIVFECANLPPYAHAVQEATKLPVFDIVTLTKMVYDAVVKSRYHGFL